MQSGAINRAIAVLVAMFAATGLTHGAGDSQDKIKSAVDAAVEPVIEKYNVPGMAVGITVAGKAAVFSYGVASKETGRPVTRDTLFELGSVTKTFTATLAAYAEVSGELSLSDKTSKYLSSLRDTKFGKLSLLHLGTHTAGGLPLQVPDNIRSNEDLMRYFQTWQPTYPPGTYRTYTNPGIGTLGLIAAKSMGQEFTALMEERFLPALGLKSSYINVPKAKMPEYAQGYTKQDVPVRMSVGVLSSEAYGIKTTAADMLRFLEANMKLLSLDQRLQRAISATHIGYFKAGVMTQDLIWEQYAYPVELKTLLEGNSPEMIFQAIPVTEIKPPQAPLENAWINKTGSTNGFAAYVAFVPQKRLGIVLLANKNFPIAERVAAAYKILTSLTAAEN